MGLFDTVRGWFGSKPVAATAAAPLASLTVATGVNAGAGGGTDASPEFSLTGTTDAILREILSRQKVTRYGNPQPVTLPVREISLRPGYNYVPDEEKGIPHGEAVTLQVLLSKDTPVTDYDPVSVNAALLNTLSAIPSFAGKIAAKPAHAHPQTYADVRDELMPLLQEKQNAFTPRELAMIKQFFDASQGKSDRAETWEKAINARHGDGKVTISIESKELPKDEKAVASADEGIAEYFKAHHDHILAQVKEKALALGVLKPDDLVHLDMHVEATGWNIAAEFGTKATATTDLQTGAKLTESELARKMTETPLSKIDTKKLEDIFTEVLLASGKELPPMLPRIMDGHMLAGIVRNRTNNDPAIGAVLTSHEMFKSEDDIKAEKGMVAKQGAILIGEAVPGETNDRIPTLTVDFTLPPGMSITQVQNDIVKAAMQMRVSAQQQGARVVAAVA